jgi:hypothetical protein
MAPAPRALRGRRPSSGIGGLLATGLGTWSSKAVNTSPRQDGDRFSQEGGVLTGDGGWAFSFRRGRRHRPARPARSWRRG